MAKYSLLVTNIVYWLYIRLYFNYINNLHCINNLYNNIYCRADGFFCLKNPLKPHKMGV